MTIAAILALLKPLLLPFLTLIAGWLLPSPLQKAKKGQEDVSEDEKKLTDSRGDIGGLDDLPQ